MFKNKWRETVEIKKSTLCIGLDPAENKQRENSMPPGVDKLAWCMQIVEETAQFASAVKINRNYIKDFAREQTTQLTSFIHQCGMLAIDDSKLCDIGSTNDAGFYQAAQDGFDCVTYCPYPGNIAESVQQAQKYGVGIIAVTLMSNPEYRDIKDIQFGQTPLFKYLSEQAINSGADGIVIGAPSPSNHITEEEIYSLHTIIKNQLALIPGIGQQGGDADFVIQLFGKDAILNVGRDIIYDSDPARKAEGYKNHFNNLLNTNLKDVV